MFADDLDAMRAEAAKEASVAYQRCVESSGIVATNPSDVEGLLAAEQPGSAKAGKIMRTLDDCAPVWRNAYRGAESTAAKAFVSKKAASLKQFTAKYADIMTTIKSDREFLTYLAGAAAAAAEATGSE
jgi:hypothetical protein